MIANYAMIAAAVIKPTVLLVVMEVKMVPFMVFLFGLPIITFYVIGGNFRAFISDAVKGGDYNN